MKTTYKPTRGERNNNPLNIRSSKTYKWLGQTGSDSDGFCVFVSLLKGVRAAFALIRSYNHNHKIDTIRGIITRWAPPNENDTESYINNVATAAGLSPDERIHYGSQQMRIVVKEMARIESKMSLDDALVRKAQSMIL